MPNFLKRELLAEDRNFGETQVSNTDPTILAIVDIADQNEIESPAATRTHKIFAVG
jgi:sugar lactone lactonase YvrE